MLANEYQALAMRTNDGKNSMRLYGRLAEHADDVLTLADPGELLNGALGLPGEAGEVADMVKKYFFHGHDLNRADLIKELGDVCWYVALLSYSIGVPLEDIMRENIEKLKARYPEGFSESASINRTA